MHLDRHLKKKQLTTKRYDRTIMRYRDDSIREEKMKLVFGALAALSLVASPAMSKTVLKVSSYLPPKHTFTRAVEAWGKTLEEKTNGELSVQVFPAGQLGPVNRQFDLVASGAADAAIILNSATPGRFPLTTLAGLPLSYPSAGNKSEITSRRLTELAPEYLSGEYPGMKILWMAVTPPLKINIKGREPSDLAALKGLRIRYAGEVFQQVLDKLGASPLPVPPAETSEALAKGIVDGATFPFEALQAFDLGPELNYSLEPGVASATFAFVMNQKTFDALTPEEQKAINETTGPDQAQAYGASWDQSEAKGKEYLEKNGVKIVTLSEDEQKKFHELVQPIVEAQIKAAAKNGAPAQAFYDAYTK
ncbi:TRAP transporter substrate-binding protein [Thioclava dalianensis]|nr:TRAP transporter substrate-binding protein [Thioclava dalianensis]